MHCCVKQIIQTLRVNDHRCAFLTNQQSHEENNRLSSVFARSREYPSGKFAPKGKSDSADAEKANKRSDRVDLGGKLRIPSVNLRPIQLVFFCPFCRSSTLTSRSSTLDTLIFPRKNIGYTYKKDGEGAKNQPKYYRISVLPVHWPSW